MPITINLSVLGDGTYTVEDDGTPGNGTSVVRDPLGNIVTTFLHPADAVTIISRAGQSLNVNITDSLTTASFTVGNLDNAFASQRPDWIQMGGVLTSGTVTLSANQFIREWGSDGATDIVAGALLMRASTGIGAGGFALETQVSALEAESSSGGIAINNINDVTLKVASAAGDLLRGLWTGTSGNVTLVNQGSILLSDNNGVESARSGGHLNLSAIGFSADISSNVNRDALLAIGNITLNAGRDVLFGTVGSDFDNDVRAGGSISISAGRDFHIDGFSDMAADDQGLASNGSVYIRTGRDILIEDDNGVDASVGVTAVASTGSVVLQTGLGGTLSLAANSPAAIQGRNGGVTILADRVLIENDSGINSSGTGTITVSTSSLGRGISVGSAVDGVVNLELSDAELDRLVAQHVAIGNDLNGLLEVIGAITHTNNQLSLNSGSDVYINADVTVPTLTVHAADEVQQTAASFINATNIDLFSDFPDLDVPGAVFTVNGALAFTNASFNGNGDSDTLTGLEGRDVTVHGNGGNDIINSTGEGHYYGDAGNDSLFAGLSTGLVEEVLDGGLGVDTLDTTSYTGSYVIDMTTGFTNFSYESFVNIENLITGIGADTITGSAADNNIQTGGGLDYVYGGNGNDTIDGGAGVDILAGQAGNDTYIIDSSDSVNEALGEGTDTVIAGFAFSLGANLENLTLTGGANINGSGNSLVNVLTGNDGDNTLKGSAGSDTLIGNGGNDTLNGGTEGDTMNGGLGNDIYLVDNALDVVNEAFDAGTDTVQSSRTFSLGANFENLTLTGSSNINGSGNDLHNYLIGNSGANTLKGGLGKDALIGGLGADVLTGGDGQDKFWFDSALGGGNVDEVTDFVQVDDVFYLEDAVFGAAGIGVLAYDAFRPGAAAVDATDRIIYDSVSGNLWYDGDGTGPVAQILFAHVDPGTAMTNTDFFVL